MQCGKVFCSRAPLIGWELKKFLCAHFDLNCLTVQSRLKIANNPNFDSTSIHSSPMKTNLLKDNISIQFEGEPCRRTPPVHQIVVESFAFFVVLDGLTCFLVRLLSTCSLYSRP